MLHPASATSGLKRVMYPRSLFAAFGKPSDLVSYWFSSAYALSFTKNSLKDTTTSASPSGTWQGTLPGREGIQNSATGSRIETGALRGGRAAHIDACLHKVRRGGTGDKCKRDGAGRPRCGKQGAAAEAARLGAGAVFGDSPPRAGGERQHGGWPWRLRSAAVLPFRRSACATASGGGSTPGRRQKTSPRRQDPAQAPESAEKLARNAAFSRNT